jgi:hypothetical protein
VHGFWPQALSQTRGVREVAEEDGNLLALAFEGTTRSEDLLGEMSRSIGLKRGSTQVRLGRRGEWRATGFTEPTVRRIGSLVGQAQEH